MTSPQVEHPQVYLKPGELLVSHEPVSVVTVLGSCVAVTFYSARLRVAAICHAMLPRPKHPRAASVEPEGERFKYLCEALPHMIAQFRQLGLSPLEVDVKLFGGGNVIGSKDADHPERWLGNVNVQTARALLDAEGFNIRAANVGGDRGRKIIFHTGTGEVRHKHLAARGEATTP
jgi:chemotaxis protein CheD